eukprot:m.40832 g.40832  ORF g.40832 m.40832 type:complete len:218 (+) comp9714_c0_seq1:242-895(+)
MGCFGKKASRVHPVTAAGREDEKINHNSRNGESVVELEKKLSEITQERDGLKHKLEGFEGRIVIPDDLSLEEKIDLLKAELQILQPYGDASGSGINGVINTATAQASLIDQLEIDITQLQREKQELKQQFDKKLRKYKGLLRKEKAASELLKLQQEETIAELRSEVQELEKKAFEAPNEALEASKGHNMLVVQLSSQIVDLEEELQQAQDQIRELTE